MSAAPSTRSYQACAWRRTSEPCRPQRWPSARSPRWRCIGCAAHLARPAPCASCSAATSIQCAGQTRRLGCNPHTCTSCRVSCACHFSPASSRAKRTSCSKSGSKPPLVRPPPWSRWSTCTRSTPSQCLAPCLYPCSSPALAHSPSRQAILPCASFRLQPRQCRRGEPIAWDLSRLMR